jgi:hypothetical protein
LGQAPKLIRPAFGINAYNTMEKPNARGPSPSRKAHLALRERLNRKQKRPPMPVKKNLSIARRTTGR